MRLAGEFERARSVQHVEDLLPVAGLAFELAGDVDDAHPQPLVDRSAVCSRVSVHSGVSPPRIFTSREESMLPPDTMHTTLPVPARPDSAAAVDSPPAPSAITRTRSASRRTAAAVSSSVADSASSTSAESIPHIFGRTTGPPAPSTNDLR